MPRTGIAESGISTANGVDFTMLAELFIDIRDARREDVGTLANIFIKSFRDDSTAQLLYPHDGIWPVVVEMLRTYLEDDYTQVRVAWDEYTDTIVGWTALSLVTSEQDDYFECELVSSSVSFSIGIAFELRDLFQELNTPGTYFMTHIWSQKRHSDHEIIQSATRPSGLAANCCAGRPGREEKRQCTWTR